ncbi:MAG TPA: DUF4013 domain-containing protein [Flavobacterium sp.]|uniref:DUF4013 domain-containing protein n=1 Tax=Flavobacterium sp. TaxID=239 RepID=UPI002B7D27CA|nr:DUF4013 domain-containing protein [Flavobacterium sp.]HSD14552.1 DUF4013 domain-containing protein [Flavobacterium sp.]
MFQLFKKRNFSELVGDTFTFFKMHGKHYYRNYFIVNGGFLLVLLVLVYFIMKVFFEGMFSNSGEMNAVGNNFDAYINDNLTLIITLGIITAICILFLSLLSYAFPVAYLKLLEKKPDFETREIVNIIKSKVGKIIIFFITSLFVFIPIMLIVFGLSFVLVFLLIGIPLLMIVIPAMMSWYSLSFYDYISTEKGYFESLGTGFTLLKQKFWPTVGSTAVMYLIMQIVVGFIAMIPYMIGIFSFITAIETQNPTGPGTEQLSFLMIMMGLTMILSILVNFIFQNFILVNQGIIYYSLREENENNMQKSEIDLIGTQSE